MPGKKYLLEVDCANFNIIILIIAIGKVSSQSHGQAIQIVVKRKYSRKYFGRIKLLLSHEAWLFQYWHRRTVWRPLLDETGKLLLMRQRPIATLYPLSFIISRLLLAPKVLLDYRRPIMITIPSIQP